MAEILVAFNLKDWKVTTLAERSDKLGVSGFIAVFSKDAEEGIVTVKSLGAFSQTTIESAMNQSALEHILNGSGNGELGFLFLSSGLVFNFNAGIKNQYKFDKPAKLMYVFHTFPVP